MYLSTGPATPAALAAHATKESTMMYPQGQGPGACASRPLALRIHHCGFLCCARRGLPVLLAPSRDTYCTVVESIIITINILIEKNFDGTHNTQKRRWPQSGVPGASTTEAAGRPPHPWRRPAVRHGGGGASATEAAGRTVGLSHPRTYAVNVSVNVRSEIKLKRFAHRRTRQRPATPF